MGKPGPKAIPYYTVEGDPVNNLRKKDGNRWRIVSAKLDFRANSEAEAIARLRAFERAQSGQKAVTLTLGEAQGTEDILSIAKNAGPGRVNIHFTPDDKPRKITQKASEAAMWQHVADQLIRRPDYVARMTGLPKLAHWQEIADAGDTPKLNDLAELYCQHAQVGAAAQRRARRVIRDFAEIAGAQCLGDITTERALRYGDQLKSAKLAPCTIRNTFTVIKTVVGFALKRGVNTKAVRAALDNLAVLTPPKGSVTLDPHPISVSAFRLLLEHTKNDPFWAAALRLSLNAALYASELLAVRWDELDLEAATFVSRRSKTQVARVAMLWPATAQSLRKLPRRGDYLFNSGHGRPYHPNSLRKLFEQLRAEVMDAWAKDAKEHKRQGKCPINAEVKFSDLRDGAYSAACAAGVDINVCRVLAGHRSGISDHYAKRSPQLVLPATEAVATYYGIS